MNEKDFKKKITELEDENKRLSDQLYTSDILLDFIQNLMIPLGNKQVFDKLVENQKKILPVHSISYVILEGEFVQMPSAPIIYVSPQGAVGQNYLDFIRREMYAYCDKLEEEEKTKAQNILKGHVYYELTKSSFQFAEDTGIIPLQSHVEPVRVLGQTVGLIHYGHSIPSTNKDFSHKVMLLTTMASFVLTRFKESVSQSIEARMSAVLFSLVDGMVIFDPFYKATFMNAAFKKKFNIIDPTLVLDQFLILLQQLVHEKEGLSFIEKLKRCLFQGEAGKFYSVHVGHKYYDVHCFPVQDADLNIVGRGVMFHDISHFHEIKKIREISALKSDFISMVSHELRTPITIIKSALDNQMEGLVPEDDPNRLLRISMQNLNRLTAIVSHHLDVARIESGNMEYNIEACDVFKIAANAISMVKKKADQKNIKIINQLRPDTPKAYMDKTTLLEICENLLTNAIKYSNAGTCVKITALCKAKYLEVSFKDQGYGISEEDQGKIFLKYIQSKQAMEQGGGVGLGLAIVKRMLNGQGAKVCVESKLGKGSTFTISLPLFKENQGKKVA